MKVKELITQLQKVDPNLHVMCYAEYEEGPDGSNVTRIFEIDHVSASEAERSRDKEGEPRLTFGRTDRSEKITFINLLSDF